MKKKFLSLFLLGLCLLSVVGIGLIIVRDMVRTPADWMNVGRAQMKAENYRGALVSLTRAAKGGEVQAAYQLGLLYDVGDKVPENRNLAIEHMKQAEKAGLADAQYALAVWTERGYFGDPDVAQAVALYEQAAEQGHQNAMKSLIVLYGTGLDGIPANKERQNYWIEKLNMKGK